MTNNEIWQAVLGEVELAVSPASFTTWFRNTSIIEFKDDAGPIPEIEPIEDLKFEEEEGPAAGIEPIEELELEELLLEPAVYVKPEALLG